MHYGRYQIIEELGRGSMGIVYKAHDPQINRTIALKVLRDDRVTSEDFVQRFQKEAMAVGRLSHPGIVTVYDVGRDHGTVYIAMEFLQGTPLDECLTTRKFTLEEVVELATQTIGALHYAHQQGIVHRDIKPPNLIYTPAGTIKITDFGIARIEDAEGHNLTQVGEILGTPLYMSPEQIAGKAVDGRSDLYSLGVILYQLTTGKRPLEGKTLVAIFQAISQETPLAPHLVDPAIPEPLSELIMGLLAKEPAARYSSGDDLLKAFQHCLDRAEPVTSETSSPATGQQKAKPGKTKIAAGIGVLLVTICLSAYYVLHQEVPAPPQPTKPASDTTLTADSSTRIVPVSIDPHKLISEGMALSVSVSSLPKKELMLRKARELGEISPRYLEDVKIAEETFAHARETQQRSLDNYFKEISSWGDNYSTEQIKSAMEQLDKDQLTARQRTVMDLSSMLLNSLKNGATLTADDVHQEFAHRFTEFSD